MIGDNENSVLSLLSEDEDVSVNDRYGEGNHSLLE